MKRCNIEGCERKYYAKGWCQRHYQKRYQKWYHKEYYKTHKGAYDKYARQWQKDNKERFLEYQRNWQRKYRLKHPLIKRLKNIKQRCNYPKDKAYKYYGGKGIKCFLTLPDLEYLWRRDKGFLLKQASIHRINNSGDYTIENCKFIEKRYNRKN